MSAPAPDLQELVARHGGYDKIRPEAWAKHDCALADGKSADRPACVEGSNWGKARPLRPPPTASTSPNSCLGALERRMGKHGTEYARVERDHYRHEIAEVQMQIPTIFVAHCEFCGEQLDIRDEHVVHCIAGWVERRAQGGGDDIRLSDMWQPEPQNRWAHESCVKRAMLQGRR